MTVSQFKKSKSTHTAWHLRLLLIILSMFWFSTWTWLTVYRWKITKCGLFSSIWGKVTYQVLGKVYLVHKHNSGINFPIPISSARKCIFADMKVSNTSFVRTPGQHYCLDGWESRYWDGRVQLLSSNSPQERSNCQSLPLRGKYNYMTLYVHTQFITSKEIYIFRLYLLLLTSIIRLY